MVSSPLLKGTTVARHDRAIFGMRTIPSAIISGIKSQA